MPLPFSGEFFYSDIKDSYPSLKRWAAIDWETSEVTHFEVPGDELQDAPNVFDRWLAFDPDSPWRLAESARDFLTEETGARFTHAGAEVDYMGYGPGAPSNRLADLPGLRSDSPLAGRAAGRRRRPFIRMPASTGSGVEPSEPESVWAPTSGIPTARHRS